MAEAEAKQISVKQRLADINSISIAIDTYDDIFSDFDPRDIVAWILLDGAGVRYYTHRCN